MPPLRVPDDTVMVAAALSISPFERSRWRLRRTRQAYGKSWRVFALCLR